VHGQRPSDRRPFDTRSTPSTTNSTGITAIVSTSQPFTATRRSRPPTRAAPPLRVGDIRETEATPLTTVSARARPTRTPTRPGRPRREEHHNDRDDRHQAVRDADRIGQDLGYPLCHLAEAPLVSDCPGVARPKRRARRRSRSSAVRHARRRRSQLCPDLLSPASLTDARTGSYTGASPCWRFLRCGDLAVTPSATSSPTR
jgi:hypothetical protein